MEFYRIIVVSPDGSRKDFTDRLNDEQVLGMIAAATSYFEAGDRDDMFMIFDQGGRKLDLTTLIDDANSVALVGEPAFDLTPRAGHWTRTIKQLYKENPILGKPLTKRYTVKADGPDGNFIFQFDSPDFLQGMATFFSVVDPGSLLGDHAAYPHEGDVHFELE